MNSFCCFLLKYADGLSVNKLYLFRETKKRVDLYYNEKSYYILGVFLLPQHETEDYVTIILAINIQNGDIF